MSARYLRIGFTVIALGFLQLASLSGHAACGEDPECDQATDWARFTSITLDLSEPGKRKPALEVKIDQKITLALMYGAGPEKLKEVLEAIKLSNGEVVSISDIWTINPMPVKGFTKEELAAVDLAEAEEVMGPNGETLREMIRRSYHCKTKEEEDKYLRRFIAS